MSKKWTEKEYQKAVEIVEKYNLSERKEKLQEIGRTYEGFRAKRRRKKRKEKNKSDNISPDDSLGREILESLEKIKSVARKLEPKRKHTVQIDEHDFFAFLITGDWHIEHTWSDTKLLLRDMELIRQAGHIYTIFVGDGGDWHTIASTHQGGQYENLLTPKMARRLIAYLMAFIKDSLIAVVAGNHDLWMQRVADYDYFQELMQKYNVNYLGSGGILMIELENDRQIKIDLQHQFPGISIYNQLHGNMRALKDGSDADLIISGHGHQSTFAENNFGGRERFYAKSCSYQQRSRWAQGRGYKPSVIGLCPWCIMHPDEETYIGGKGVPLLIKIMEKLRND